MSLTETDFGLEAIREVMEQLQQTSVTFGYQGPSGEAKHPGANVSVAQVAAMAEFGTKSSPARPLGRETMDREKDEFARLTKQALSDVVDGRGTDPDEVAEPLGIHAVRELRRTIDQSRDWAAENAESTARSKGHDQPLVGEHGQLYEKATYAIRRNGVIVKQGAG